MKNLPVYELTEILNTLYEDNPNLKGLFSPFISSLSKTDYYLLDKLVTIALKGKSTTSMRVISELKELLEKTS